MIGIGEKVRITDGWAEGQTAEVVESDLRYLDLEMNDGTIACYPPWRVRALGTRCPVKEATDRRFRRWRARGGVL